MKLIALDLDGTLFNNKSQISKENIKAIKEATAAGINVVISTGRPFGGQLRTPASATLSLQTEVQSTKLTQKNVFTKTAFLMRQRFQ